MLNRINKRQSTASEAESAKERVKLGEERKVSHSSCISSFFSGRKINITDKLQAEERRRYL